MDRLLQWGLETFIRRGNLRVTTATGRVFHFGDGSGPPVALLFTSAATQRAVMLDPEVKVGEAYMDGTLQIEEGTIANLLALVLGQTPDGMPPIWARPQWFVRYLKRRLQQLNLPSRARRNVAHHYDLDGRLTPSSSMPTGNTAAPISKRPVNRSTMRSSPRSAISPPSS